MPLTPADVANKQFKIAFRGYSLDEVDSVLDEVEGELGRLLRENAELRSTPGAREVAAPIPAYVPPPAAAPPAPGEGQEAALRTLLLAQRTADEAVREAQAEAAKIVADAEARAANVDHEIARRISEAMGGVDERKRQLELEIEDLRTFEREYRTRLKAYLESQLSELVGRGAPDDAGVGVPAAARTAAISGAVTAPAPPAAPPAAAPAPQAPAPQAHAPAPQAAPPAPPPAPSPPPSYAPVPPAATPAVPAAPTAPPVAAPAVSPPSAPPREAAPRPVEDPPQLRAVPPLQTTTGAESIGPFTVVPPSIFTEQLDEGPEPPTER